MKDGIDEVIEMESKAKTIIRQAENEAETIRRDADKESKHIIADAKNRAQKIIDNYKNQIINTRKSEKRYVKRESKVLENKFLNKYEKVRNALLNQLIDKLLEM